jgi:hypothetical protein
MIRSRLRCLIAGLLLAILCSFAASAQNPAPDASAATTQPDYQFLTVLVNCPDVKCLDAHRQQVGDRKLSKIVYFEKWFLLEPSRAAAEGLLRNLPDSELEEQQMMTLPDPHDGTTKSGNAAGGLAEIYQNWPHSVAEAVMVFPQYLPVYIRYGLLARDDIHSDYTGNEERVCHHDPQAFQDAFYRLDRKTADQIRKHVFNPEKCRAIFQSESD